MVTYTTTYNLKKPTVADDEDVWGGYLNDSMDIIDDVLDGTVPVTGIDINSGTLDNVVIGGSTANSGTFTVLSATTSLGVTGNITVSGTVDGRDIATDGTKLDGIEASADVTDTANVTAAGALMDSEVTNLAQVKAFSSSDYATAAQGTTADAALARSGGTMTGAITFAAGQTFDGRDVSADGSKLDGIESGATADQTASEILTLIKTVDGAGSGLDADTLDGVSSGSFLRSDAADTATGDITFSGAAQFSGTIGNSTTALDSVRIGRSSGGDPQIQLTGNGVNAHIDFSNTSGEDYDVRLINSATNQLDIQGTSSTGLKSNGNTVWHAGNDGAGSGLDADNLDGYTWASSGKDVRATNFYADDWFRNYNSGEGMYNQVTTQHFYSDHDDWWNVAGGTTANGIRFRDEHGGTIRGAVYADNSNGIGFLDSDQQWAYRHYRDSRHEWLINNSEYMQLDTSGLFLHDGSLREDYDALSGTSPTCNVNSGGAFSLTMSGNTTFTFTSPTSGYSTGFILQLTGNGGTVTWPASVDWAGGTAPDAPASGETDIYVFWTRDGGTTWYGVQSIDAAA